MSIIQTVGVIGTSVNPLLVPYQGDSFRFDFSTDDIISSFSEAPGVIAGDIVVLITCSEGFGSDADRDTADAGTKDYDSGKFNVYTHVITAGDITEEEVPFDLTNGNSIGAMFTAIFRNVGSVVADEGSSGSERSVTVATAGSSLLYFYLGVHGGSDPGQPASPSGWVSDGSSFGSFIATPIGVRGYSAKWGYKERVGAGTESLTLSSVPVGGSVILLALQP